MTPDDNPPPALIADDLTPGTIHNYARRVGLPSDEAERCLRAEFAQREADAASSCATVAAMASLRRDLNDRPLADWTLVDVRHNRHRWQHEGRAGRIETVNGGRSTGWLIEIRLPDGRLMSRESVSGGVANAMRAAIEA